MGWWGHGVMQGDPPYDAEHAIYLVLTGEPSEDYDGWRNDAITALKAEGAVQKLLDDDSWGDDDGIAIQVLGYLCMTHGVSIDLFKDQLIASVDGDEWAQSNDERKSAMQHFRAQIDAYNGTAMDLSSQDKGLLATIADHLAEGKSGLVNK